MSYKPKHAKKREPAWKGFIRRMSEGGDTMGKHGGGGTSSGGGGGKHEGVDKDKPSTGGSKGGTPETPKK